MRYLIPRFDCVLNGEKKLSLYKNVQYSCENVDNENFIIFGKNGESAVGFNFVDISSHFVEKVKYKNDEYYFLFYKPNSNEGMYQFKYQAKQICVALFGCLNISIDGENVFNEQVEGLSYSHFEIKNQHCFIYFFGKRNYVVVISGSEVKIATYYDEINVLDNEFYFMCKIKDSLNHGKVFHIKDKTFEEYLVYLDDNDLNLKNEFVGCVFMDCVLAGNFSYANNLLANEIKQKNETNIQTFFEKFDFYFPINQYEFILLKKNTLAGIYSFEIENCKITNIIQQDL